MFIPLSVTLAVFQGRRTVEQFQLLKIHIVLLIRQVDNEYIIFFDDRTYSWEITEYFLI